MDPYTLSGNDVVFGVLGGLASAGLLRLIGGKMATFAAGFFGAMVFFGVLVILAIT
jgi:hypothetical protein